MPGIRQQLRGTTFVPRAMDVTAPSDLLLGPGSRRHAWDRWWRPLLCTAATAAALALLLATRPW